MKGKVKWYEPKKGYGFILSQDGKDVFMHRSYFEDIENTNQGEELEFDIIPGEKGFLASKIKKVV